MTTDDIIAMRKACDMQGLSQEFEALVAERDAAQRDNAKLRTVMIAAAEEISAHWDAHCDAEGYGPANLMHRLEQGIPSEYGYTPGAFAELKAERDALKAESLLWSHRAGEDAAQHRKTVEERDALRQDAEAFRMAVECGEPFVVRGACVTSMSGKHEDFNPHIPGDDLRATREIIHRAYAQFKGQR